MNRNLHQDLNRMMDVIAHNRGPIPGQYAHNQPTNTPMDHSQDNTNIHISK